METTRSNVPALVADYIKEATAYEGSSPLAMEGKLAFEKWLSKQPAVDGVTLYRGYCFDPRYWEDGGPYEVGDILNEDSFTQSSELPAFTTSPLRASGYMNEYGEGLELYHRIKVLFEIHTHGKNFVDISGLSRYPSEAEHRCKRDTTVRIVKIKMTSYIHIICEE